VVEICAGAGGQSLGLMRAGFEHTLAVELDESAAATLEHNLRSRGEHGARVIVGDVADSGLWTPEECDGVDLLAGGAPCPPLSAGPLSSLGECDREPCCSRTSAGSPGRGARRTVRPLLIGWTSWVTGVHGAYYRPLTMACPNCDPDSSWSRLIEGRRAHSSGL